MTHYFKDKHHFNKICLYIYMFLLQITLILWIDSSKSMKIGVKNIDEYHSKALHNKSIKVSSETNFYFFILLIARF